MTAFGPGDIRPGMTGLDVALTQLGVRESAPNRGQQVDLYLASVGIDPSAGSFPWCAAFAYWCCQQAGLWIPRTARVHTLWERREAMVVKHPEPGDLCIRVNNDATGHCGFFMRLIQDDGSLMVESCDGNTNAVGSREGDRVAIKARPFEYWNRGFLRPAKLTPPDFA